MTVDCTRKPLLTVYLTVLDKAKANLALDSILNFDRKVGCKLKHVFSTENYDRKTFIAQATERCQK